MVCPCYRSPRCVGRWCRFMALEIASFLALALALGFKHSYDADHLVAVSNLLTRESNVRRAAWLSTTWALGHMVTASVVTVLLFLASRAVLGALLAHFELAVGIMLLGIGALGLAWEFGLYRRLGAYFRRIGVLHEHPHDHGARVHRHPHLHVGNLRRHGAMFGIGIVHGLASNDELLILFVAALGVATLPALLLGVGVFTIGVALGMIVFAVGLTYPLLRWGDVKVRRVVNGVTATISIAYGLFLVAGPEGLRLFPVG